MRLEAMLLPNALHGRVPNTHLLGHHPCCPVGSVPRLLLDGLGHNLQASSIVNALLACSRPLAFVLEQPLDATLHIGLLPAPNGGFGDACLAFEGTRAKAAPRQQSDAGACRQFLRRLAIGNEPLQSRSIIGTDV